MRLTAARFRQGAFTLVEMAVVLAIVGLLVASLMYTLTAQVEQRAREQTQRTLEQARETLLGFAIANGRLPCPASSGSAGAEAVGGGSVCTNYYDGFLPAVTLGFQPQDSQGYALDAWNNRIRYALVQNIGGCAGTSVVPHFTSKTNLKQNGMSCLPTAGELLICKSAVTTPPPSTGTCGAAGNAVTNANPNGTVVAILLSTGKNYATATTAAAATAAGNADEAANLDGNTVFISHTVAPVGATGGEYDDIVVWIPVGVFYGRLTAAGVLP